MDSTPSKYDKANPTLAIKLLFKILAKAAFLIRHFMLFLYFYQFKLSRWMAFYFYCLRIFIRIYFRYFFNHGDLSGLLFEGFYQPSRVHYFLWLFLSSFVRRFTLRFQHTFFSMFLSYYWVIEQTTYYRKLFHDLCFLNLISIWVCFDQNFDLSWNHFPKFNMS